MRKSWRTKAQVDNLKSKYMEEKRMNTLMFWEMTLVPAIALVFVMCFLDGEKEDVVVLLMSVSSILVRIFEKKLGTYAKYLYISIMPILGAVTIVVDHDGRFGAMDHGYLWQMTVCAAGYAPSVLVLNIILTIGCNVGAFVLFPESYLNLRSIPLWIFIILIYLLTWGTTMIIYQRLHDQDQTKQQMELYKKQMDIMKLTEKKVRGLRHDMKHHTRELSRLAKEERCEDILTYLQVMDGFMENPSEYVSSGNKELDAICNFLLENAAGEGIEIEAKSDIPEEISVPVFALNSILGNLLENATEAALRTVEKKIQMNMYVKKGVLYISIANSYDGVLYQNEKGEIVSRKEEENHGYGLKNVKRILKAYHGAMKIRHDQEMFRVDVMLYL